MAPMGKRKLDTRHAAYPVSFAPRTKVEAALRQVGAAAAEMKQA
jgi:hypothetical protein